MVRPYHPTDRPAIERICVQSGLKGRLENYFCDEELFAKLWLAPFLDAEPESCWVAEVDGEVVGYLVSAIKPTFRTLAPIAVAPHIIKLTKNWLTGKYRHHAPSVAFAKWVLFRSWRELPPSPVSSSNFHFNVLGESRGATRIGDELMNQYFSALRELGKETFYVHIFGMPGKRDLQFYRRIAFKILGVKRCSIFKEPTVVASLQRLVPANDLNWREIKTRDVPKVSVVIVADRITATLKGLMDDMAGQALPPEEVVLVRNGISSAGRFSEAITSDLETPDFVTCVDGEYENPQMAQSAGIRASKGDILVLIDADTRVEVDFIAKIVSAIDMGYSAGTFRQRCLSKNPFTQVKIAMINVLPPIAESSLGGQTFIKRDLIEHGIFKISPRLIADQWLRVKSAVKVGEKTIQHRFSMQTLVTKVSVRALKIIAKTGVVFQNILSTRIYADKSLNGSNPPSSQAESNDSKANLY